MDYNQMLSVALAAFIIIGMVIRPRFSHIPTWGLMSLASFIAVVAGPVEVDQIPQVVNLEVILFLIGMFSIVALAETSGLLEAFAYWFVSLFKTRLGVFIGSSFLFGIMSAFFVNDTVALMGPPIALAVAKAAGIPPAPMLMLLAFSLTVGSVMTPMGNP